MAFGGGLALKSVSFFLRLIQFSCAAIILGIFSYYLAALHNHKLSIDTYIKAVEGISGAAVLYTIIALLLLCFLAGITFFSIIGIILDICFLGAFVYIAWATRGGANSCTGFVNTPLGSGDVNGDNSVSDGSGGFVIMPNLKTSCKLETACFAVAIVGIFFFFLSILVELALMRHHRREKAFGPSPNNGYTAGSPRRRFWQRKPRNKHNRDAEYLAAEKNPNSLPVHATPADVRTSYATESTAVGDSGAYNKYGNTTPAVAQGGTGGYQTTTSTHVPAQTHANF
jgi:hypothetical protein